MLALSLPFVNKTAPAILLVIIPFPCKSPNVAARCAKSNVPPPELLKEFVVIRGYDKSWSVLAPV